MKAPKKTTFVAGLLHPVLKCCPYPGKRSRQAMDPMLLACSHVEFLRSTLRSDHHGNGARVVAAAQPDPLNMAGVRSPHVCCSSARKGSFVLCR